MIQWQTAVRQARARDYPHHDRLVLGSWIARLSSDRREYISFLRAHFRQETTADCSVERGAWVRMVHCGLASPPFSVDDEIPEDTLCVRRPATGRITVATPLVRVIATRRSGREEITVFLLGDMAGDGVLSTHLSVAFRRLLLESGLFYLHAGAVESKAFVSLFIGEKGAGKSTVCLRLAQAGGCLLSDDHVLVKRRGGRYLVSGSDQSARITSDTERFLFRHPLATAARDFAGVPKKEFATAELFHCSPFRDYPLRDLFFPRVGREFSIRPIPEVTATLRLIAGNKHGLRFTDRQDYDAVLDFFSGMVKGKRTFELELSPDPADLNQLVTFLRNG